MPLTLKFVLRKLRVCCSETKGKCVIWGSGITMADKSYSVKMNSSGTMDQGLVKKPSLKTNSFENYRISHSDLRLCSIHRHHSAAPWFLSTVSTPLRGSGGVLMDRPGGLQNPLHYPTKPLFHKTLPFLEFPPIYFFKISLSLSLQYSSTPIYACVYTI